MLLTDPSGEFRTDVYKKYRHNINLLERRNRRDVPVNNIVALLVIVFERFEISPSKRRSVSSAENSQSNNRSVSIESLSLRYWSRLAMSSLEKFLISFARISRITASTVPRSTSFFRSIFFAAATPYRTLRIVLKNGVQGGVKERI